MSVLIARVADLAEQVRGVSYAKEDARATPRPGYLPVLRAGNITDSGLNFDDLVFVPSDRVSSKQRVRKNDVLIAASSGSLDVVGKAARALSDYEAGFGAFCKVLRPAPQVDPGYFAHFFRTEGYRRRVAALAAGININNLRNEHLAELRIPLPPLAEQRRIAAILDKADALRAKRRAALAQLDALTQAIFRDMFGDPSKNSHGWPTACLRDLVSEFRYGTSSKSGAAGHPVLRIPNVVGGEINLSDLKFVDLPSSEFNRLKLEDGDILFVRTNGNPDFVGRCAVFDGNEMLKQGLAPNVVFASYLIRARLRSDLVSSVYIREFMSAPEGRRRLRERAKTSAGQFNINTEGLGMIAIPVPPVSLQCEFASRIAATRDLRSIHMSAATELDALFASLQHRAFRGEL